MIQDFFASIFELFGNVQSEISDVLYDYIYMSAGFLMIFLTGLMVFLFYFGIYRKTAKFNTRVHWFIWLFVTCFVSTIGIWLFTSGTFNQEGFDYVFYQYFEFLVMVFLWSAVLFFLLSLAVKNLSPSRRRLPF